MTIFSDRLFNQKLSNFSIDFISDLNKKKDIIEKYIKAIESGRIERTKEEAIKADFLNNFFGNILDYEYESHDKWYLEKEFKSVTDATKPDAALGYFSISTEKIIKYDVRVVIEIKDALTNLDKPQARLNDKRTSIEQAFSYVSKSGGNCKWVIVSNFKEIRLYHSSDQAKYEVFEIRSLVDPDIFKKFFYLLSCDNLINEAGESLIDRLYRERQEAEQEITKKFYAQYKQLRLELFNNLILNNPNHNKLFLLEKTQKLLDRFIFVCFCEDAGLIPPNIIKNIKDVYSKSLDRGKEIWRQLTALFNSIDKGNPPLDINKFNGGLFTQDIELDKLIIKDDVLIKLLLLADYDFASDLNVNILGHIFEQSISDIEQIKEEINKDVIASSDDIPTGKRKKEGIFYTPEYITRYIVKEAIGSWLDDRKTELGFFSLPELSPQDFASVKTVRKRKDGKMTTLLEYNSNIELHLKFWDAYKEKLLNIKVLDPACGSGAFLNQVFDFLYKEGQAVNDEISKLKGGQREAFELDRHILTNNIYGVDLNSESVEITKLSLWLKTANKGKELTALDKNILCGNSLIDDIDVADEKAFNWFDRFPSVFPHYLYRKDLSEAGLRTLKARLEVISKYPDFGDANYLDELEEPAYSYKPGSKGFDKNGFDIIIGNPPYVDIKNLPEKIVKYLFDKFEFAENRINLYAIFIEKGLRLLKANGYLSFINPNSLLFNSSYRTLRKKLYDGISNIVKLPDDVFEEAKVETIIFVYKNSVSSDKINTIIYNKNDKIIDIDISLSAIVDKSRWMQNDDYIFNLYVNDKIEILLNKIKSESIELKEIADFSLGITPYDKYKGHSKELIDNRIYHSLTKLDKNYKPLITGENITRFYVSSQINEYIKYGDWLGAPRDVRFFKVPRIIVRQIVSGNPIRIYAGYTDSELYYTQIGFGIISTNNDVNIKYLLCLLNSRLLNFYHKYRYLDIEKELFQKLLIENCKHFPIKMISPEDQQPFIEKADMMINLNKEFQQVRTEFLSYITSKYSISKPTTKLKNWNELDFKQFIDELKKLKIKLNAEEEFQLKSLFDSQHLKAQSITTSLSQTDNEIDKMVCELYRLEEDEIKIVEDK